MPSRSELLPAWISIIRLPGIDLPRGAALVAADQVRAVRDTLGGAGDVVLD